MAPLGGKESEQVELQVDSEALRCVVMQCSVPSRVLPPPDFLLADPTLHLPLLTLLVQPDARRTLPVRVKLWGMWCDRLCEIIRIGTRMTLIGSTVVHSVSSFFVDSTTLVLEPLGFSHRAAVHVEEDGRYIEVTPSGITHRNAPPHPARQAPAQLRVAAPSRLNSDISSIAQPAAASKRRRDSTYQYHRLDQLPSRTGVAGTPKEVHIFGVVLEYMLPKETRGTDMKSVRQHISRSARILRAVQHFHAHSTPSCVRVPAL